jgi:hypothetical protein
MSYLGQVELKSSEIRRIDVTGSTSATHTLTWTPASEQSLIITINGIKQQNNYSISGVTLTLDDALLSADAMEVVGILDIGEAVVPPDDSITNAMVKSDAAIASSKLASPMLLPSQPAFLAYLSTNANDVTGNNVRYYVICDTETFDQNADYNNSTGIFTAPVTGRYYLHGSITTGEQTATNTDADMEVVTSNATMSKYYSPANMEGPASSGQCTIEMNGFFDMDASDTFRMNVVFVQGTQTIDVHANNNTFMSAVLIC